MTNNSANQYSTTISIEQPNKEEKTIDYPIDFFTHKKIISRQRELINGSTKGIVNEYLFDGICIEEREVHINSPLEVNVKHTFPYLKMHFEINGYSTYIPNNEKSLPVIIPGGKHQLFYFPSVDGRLFYNENSKRKTLEITLSLKFIKQAFQENWEILESFGDALFDNKPFVFGEESETITHDILNIITQITSCSLPDHLRRAYLKSKVTELLVLQLYYLNKTNTNKSKKRPQHYDKIISARSFMLEHMNQNLNIDLLSKHVGLNSNLFKKGFNDVYGIPFFQYLTSLRMKKAVYLLDETDNTISEISNKVGYTYSQHFSKVFKKHFGVTPSQFRQKEK
ncbi:MAG: helix-turn-helix transcriptional regulator [Flavobacteriales bacterium]|nr:helix-turn-helix transcriptional regulator [Flavobacteriales bacterium]